MGPAEFQIGGAINASFLPPIVSSSSLFTMTLSLYVFNYVAVDGCLYAGVRTEKALLYFTMAEQEAAEGSGDGVLVTNTDLLTRVSHARFQLPR